MDLPYICRTIAQMITPQFPLYPLTVFTNSCGMFRIHRLCSSGHVPPRLTFCVVEVIISVLLAREIAT